MSAYEMPRPTTRILIVDDHPIVRDGYAQLIGNQEDLEVCGSACSEQDALIVAEQTDPDLAIVDVTLKDSNGIELISEFRTRYQGLKILVISAHDDNLYAERAIEAGALGYINKQEATPRLIDGIRSVLAGDVYVSNEIARRMLKQRVAGRGSSVPSSAMERLTNRELQVYEMIGHGCVTKQIAGKLHISPKTVERYKENIKQKLGISNATELVQRATRWVIEQT